VPVGLALPVGVDPAGGADLVEADTQANKIIRIALSPCYSDHAFQQDLGLGEGGIFDLATPEGKARLQARIKRLFAAFYAEARFRLVAGSIKLEDGPQEGELSLELKYKDIESDEQYILQEVLQNVVGV
jgi:hypothetical protein